MPSEMNRDGSRGARGHIRRVALLSPTSGNLGNATLQLAMIANLRKRVAGIEIVGVTLNPDDTRRRLGIEAFPLAAVSRPFYGLYTSDGFQAGQGAATKPRRIKEVLKKIPGLRRLVLSLRTWRTELAHMMAAARQVRKLDRIIVPGGGSLDDSWGGPWGHPWTLFKWTLVCRLCRAPFLFVSIGKSSLEHPLSRFFVRVALRLAAYRSYRDTDSKLAVQALVDASQDPVYPDLAFSYPYAGGTATRKGPDDPRLLVGVSPIAFCDPRVWPEKDEGRYTRYLSQLAEMVKWLIKEHYRVLLFTTDSPDMAAANDLEAMISATASGGDALERLPGSLEQSPDSLLQGISGADLTIASRLHGVILSHLNATPVLALSFDRKVDAHMEAVGQKDYCLSIDHLRQDILVERFTALKAARHREEQTLRSAAQRFRRLLDEQYQRIVGAADATPASGPFETELDAPVVSMRGGLKSH